MTNSTILLYGSDWVTIKGIQYVLESDGHHVLATTSEEEEPTEAGGAVLGMIAVNSVTALEANPAVALCARHGVPVVWLLTQGVPDRLIQETSVSTVGVLVMPVHESQLLAAVGVGLSLAKSLRMRTATPLDGPVASPPTSLRSQAAKTLDHLPLTIRQSEIARMMLDGYRVSTIAESLGITPATVRAHLNRIFSKLGVNSQAALVKMLKGHAAAVRGPEQTA